MDESRSWFEWLAGHSQRRAIRHKLAKQIRKHVIIETKVSRLRRFVEIVITTFFTLLILYLALVLVDDVFLWFTGHSLFGFVYRPEPIVGAGGLAAIIVLFIVLYVGASAWLALKHYWSREAQYDIKQNYVTTTSDLAEYFELSIDEVERRQHAGILIIEENFENDRMIELRKRALKLGLQSDWENSLTHTGREHSHFHHSHIRHKTPR